MMEELKIEDRIAYLEQVNVTLLMELLLIHELLISVGFDEGIETVKLAAQEILDDERGELFPGTKEDLW